MGHQAAIKRIPENIRNALIRYLKTKRIEPVTDFLIGNVFMGFPEKKLSLATSLFH
jgi:hypothetical protein